MSIEIRNTPRGAFDEVVANDCDVHIEMMSDTHLWMEIRKGSQTVMINLVAFDIECFEEPERSEEVTPPENSVDRWLRRRTTTHVRRLPTHLAKSGVPGSYLRWTPERVARLATMWAAGLSAAVIGRAFGVTKNAITGKRRRLGLPERGDPLKPGSRQRA